MQLEKKLGYNDAKNNIITWGNYMAKIYKKHSSSVKATVALESLKGEKTVAELCQKYGVAASQIFAWKKQLEEGCEKLFEGTQKDSSKEEIDRLHKIIGQLAAERDFLEHVLKR